MTILTHIMTPFFLIINYFNFGVFNAEKIETIREIIPFVENIIYFMNYMKFSHEKIFTNQ
jgi:hypothetical protein